ncbi:MAG: Gfo/Idh/MocA family oxidoreductase [Planctomycetes bacterium]|nr:Gfo/Idh/MocA family oxidoreductase [Planctomycetota bacterium]
MSELHLASEAVRLALREGRIGTPVSLRLIAHTTPDHGQLLGLVGRCLDLACEWLGAPPLRLHATGGVPTGQISTLLRCAAGQTALVSVGSAAWDPLVHLVLVGTRGILAWEPDGSQPSAAADPAPAHPSEGAETLLRAVLLSLQTHDVVDVSQLKPLQKLDEGQRSPAPRTGTAKTAPAPPRPVDPPLRQAVHRRSGPTPPYGVLLVTGAHTHQENYAEAFAADPRCRLVGLTDEPDLPPRRNALNEQLARALSIPLLPSLDEALARPDVHIVSICAQPERRARIICRCANAGKHLYLDKPLAASVAEAGEIVEAVCRAGVYSQMFSQVHATPAARARLALDSGKLGDVVAVHCDLFFAKGPAGTADLAKPRVETRQPQQFEAIESKRELFNVGVYPLVLIRWLLGRAVHKVCAVIGNYFFREHQQNDMEDFATLILELEGGVTATIAVGRTGWPSHPAGGVNATYLMGTKAVARIDAYRPRLAVWADEPPWSAPRRHPEDPMGFWSSTQKEVSAPPKRAWLVASDGGKEDVRYFLDCLEQGRPSDVSAKEAAAALEALMAAYESAALGRAVALAKPRGARD